jgi:hypothetical protein
MPIDDFPRDMHPELSPNEDAKPRGTNPKGLEDEHLKSLKTELPPVRRDYRQSDTNARIDQLLREDKPRHRIQTLFPYLLIRAVPKDRGAGRPLWPPTVCWESCDIHLLPAKARKFDFGSTVLNPVAGETYKVFVHVWNLGRFAAYGARLKVWWVEPGYFNGTPDPRYQPHFIGGTYFDLGDRDSADSHRLIEVPTPWTVVMNHEGHECLIAAVECATDPWDGAMEANTHRHVAQRNLNLVKGDSSLSSLVSQLGALISREDKQLVITQSSVGRTDFVGAQERGLADSREVPQGWNHGGLVFGKEDRPLVGVRPGRDGMRFFDLRKQKAVPLPDDRLPGGVTLNGELGQELPVLLQQTLGIRDLRATSVARALGSQGEPRLLRFVTTDQADQAGGYSVMVVP